MKTRKCKVCAGPIRKSNQSGVCKHWRCRREAGLKPNHCSVEDRRGEHQSDQYARLKAHLVETYEARALAKLPLFEDN